MDRYERQAIIDQQQEDVAELIVNGERYRARRLAGEEPREWQLPPKPRERRSEPVPEQQQDWSGWETWVTRHIANALAEQQEALLDAIPEFTTEFFDAELKALEPLKEQIDDLKREPQLLREEKALVLPNWRAK